MAATTLLFDGVKTASTITRRVLVFYSGGKDSVVTLDLCNRYFDYVQPVFMYASPILSFQSAIIRWAEARYGVPPLLVPHPMLAEWLRYGTFRPPDYGVPTISFLDVYTYVRSQTGIWWIAAGERIADSIVRRAMIKHDGGCIDDGRGRFYPVANWQKDDVVKYIKHHKLKVSPESAYLGYSFRSLAGKDLHQIKRHYPDDYDALKAWFPLLGASLAKYEFGLENTEDTAA
ncbi:MAG: phosphoadenosine phosphosulfate reductase family protein [Desulfovibrio sp.]|jgi:phosphoadenosine phosphosulfate reductase|nr:phosphoadenosine phosphosulfate reductase family protein [Desulfovibrio sp.]